MVRNIIIILILVVVVVPSWQIGGIMLERKQVRYMIQEHANSIRRYQNEETVKDNLKQDLKARNLAPEFKFELMDIRKAKISYNYRAAASVFNHTYYEVAENIDVVTEDSAFDDKEGKK